jgi:hypothetical protein
MQSRMIFFSLKGSWDIECFISFVFCLLFLYLGTWEEKNLLPFFLSVDVTGISYLSFQSKVQTGDDPGHLLFDEIENGKPFLFCLLLLYPRRLCSLKSQRWLSLRGTNGRLRKVYNPLIHPYGLPFFQFQSAAG